MTDPADTTPETLMRVAEIGRKAGLRFVYAGNLPGRVGDLENTRCPKCSELLIERYGYLVRSYHLTAEGTCPRCGTSIPGRWAPEFEGQIASAPFLPRIHRRSNRPGAIC